MKKLNHKIPILLILALGIMLRMLYILEIRKTPFFYSPFGDPDFFDRWAMDIATGNIIGKEVFFKAPLYSYVLSLFYRIFGHNLLIPRLLNVIFDGFSIFLITLIGKRIFNETTGIIAGILIAVCGMFIYFSGEILGTSLAVLISLVLLYYLLVRDNSIWTWFVTGFFLSLAIIVRPNFLIFIPVIIIYVLFQRLPKRFRIKSAILFFAGSLTLLLVSGIRNYTVGRDVVLLNYSGGVNFFIGNNAYSDGISAVLPGYGNDWDEYSIAEHELKRELKPSEVSRFWLKKGFDSIGSEPFHSASLFLRKFYLLFNGKEISNNQNIYGYLKYSRIMKYLVFLKGSKRYYFAFPSSLIFALGLSGIFLSLRRRKNILLPLLLIASYGFSVILFFVSSRYRMVFMAFIIPFSAYSLYCFVGYIRKGEKLFLWFFSFIPFLFLSNFDPYSISMENQALEYYNLGNVYLKKCELEQAREYYRKGIEENPSFPGLHLNLGSVYFKEHNLEAAEKEYLTEIAISPNDARSYHNLSLLYEKEARLNQAIFYGKEAIEKKPRFFEAYLSLSRLYIKKADYDSALPFLQKAYRLKKEDIKTISLLGFVNLKQGNYEQAIGFYNEAIRISEGDEFLYYNLSVAYIGIGKLDLAREQLIHTLSLNKDFAAAHYNLGIIYLKENDIKRAREEFREVLLIDPNFSGVKKMIEKID